MTITIEIPADVEQELRDLAARGDAEAIRRVLIEAIAPTVEELLQQPPRELTLEEFEALADEMADIVDEAAGPHRSPLPPEALTRAGIYGDHP